MLLSERIERAERKIDDFERTISCYSDELRGVVLVGGPNQKRRSEETRRIIATAHDDRAIWYAVHDDLKKELAERGDVNEAGEQPSP